MKFEKLFLKLSKRATSHREKSCPLRKSVDTMYISELYVVNMTTSIYIYLYLHTRCTLTPHRQNSFKIYLSCLKYLKFCAGKAAV